MEENVNMYFLEKQGEFYNLYEPSEDGESPKLWPCASTNPYLTNELYFGDVKQSIAKMRKIKIVLAEKIEGAYKVTSVRK